MFIQQKTLLQIVPTTVDVLVMLIPHNARQLLQHKQCPTPNPEITTTVKPPHQSLVRSLPEPDITFVDIVYPIDQSDYRRLQLGQPDRPVNTDIRSIEPIVTPLPGLFHCNKFLVKHIHFGLGIDKERFIDTIEPEHIATTTVRLHVIIVAAQFQRRYRITAFNNIIAKAEPEILKFKIFAKKRCKRWNPSPACPICQHIDLDR